jgi:hypothetical protein
MGYRKRRAGVAEQNLLVNDLVQDYANEQNTQFESTVAVFNGSVIVAYVDANQGGYSVVHGQ